MIMIIGDWESDRVPFDKAKEHLIDTEVHHQIYGTRDIISIPEVFTVISGLSYNQQIDILLCLLRCCDTVYMLKSWEYNNDARLLHDYADVNGYKIIYSKKF